MAEAHDTWQARGETLEQVEARIHDGVPPEEYLPRARGYITQVLQRCGGNVARDAAVLEIGPGVGYPMQAFMSATGCQRVTGLDIAQGMIAHARARIARDKLEANRYVFALYDGLTFPFADASQDFIYSVAAIQHVPKHLQDQMFVEVVRVLKPGGRAVLHLIGPRAWPIFRTHGLDVRAEIRRAAFGLDGHHHYLRAAEGLRLLFGELGVRCDVQEDGINNWVVLHA